MAFQFTSSAHSEKSLKVDRVMEPAQSLNQKHHLKQAPSLKLKETVCDSSSDSPLPVGNSDPSAEAAVTPTTASLDGSGKAESAPVLPASLESPAADNEAKKEVSKPPRS